MRSNTVNPDDLVVLPELENYNIKRTDDELGLLESQILSDGKIRDPLVCWEQQDGTKVVVDGFSRLRIALKHGFALVPIESREFSGISEVKIWIRFNQDSRRNLTEFQRSYFIGEMYSLVKENKDIAKQFLNLTNETPEVVEGGEAEQHESAYKQVMRGLERLYGVKTRTIQRNYALFKSVREVREKDEMLAADILAERVEVNKGDLETIKPEVIQAAKNGKELKKLLLVDRKEKIQSKEDSKGKIETEIDSDIVEPRIEEQPASVSNDTVALVPEETAPQEESTEKPPILTGGPVEKVQESHKRNASPEHEALKKELEIKFKTFLDSPSEGLFNNIAAIAGLYIKATPVIDSEEVKSRAA